MLNWTATGQIREHHLTETAIWNKLYEFQKDGAQEHHRAATAV